MRHAVTSGSITPVQAISMLSNPQTAKSISSENKEALRAVISSGGKVTPEPGETTKEAIERLAASAPTVAEIQSNPQAVTVGSTATDTPTTLKQAAQQTQQQAAQGSSGTKPFVVDTAGTVTSSDVRQAAEAGAQTAATATTGTQPSTTDSQGATELKINHSQPSTQPTNVTVTNNQTINQTSNDWSRDYSTTAQPPAPPAGRRSSGEPLDGPGTSVRESGGAPRHAVPPTPPDHPASIPDPKDFL